MANTEVTSSNSKRETKGDMLNQIVKDLMTSCDSILAVIIADWQGLSFASKLPEGVNEDEISATILFTIEGAEGTRKELERTLLGNKLSYLVMVTERNSKMAYIVICPIETLGYIAAVSYTREDMGVIIQNLKTAVQKAAEILAESGKAVAEPQDNLEQLIAPKYDKLMEKLSKLKKVKLNLFGDEAKRMESSPLPSIPQVDPPPPILNNYSIELPPVKGPPSLPTAPLEFLEVETEIEDSEPDIVLSTPHTKFQVEFVDAKRTRYMVIIDAADPFDAEVKLKERKEFQGIRVLKITKAA